MVKKKRDGHILQYRKFQVTEDKTLSVNLGKHVENWKFWTVEESGGYIRKAGKAREG